MKKLSLILIGFILAIGTTVNALPISRSEQNILPFVDNTYFIGTTSPSNLRFKSIFLGTGTSTGANGFDITGGCFSINGVCAGTGAGIVGSGTQGQFPFYNAAGTTLTATSTLFVSQDQKIGIGTTSPSSTLTIGNDSSGVISRLNGSAFAYSGTAATRTTPNLLSFKQTDATGIKSALYVEGINDSSVVNGSMTTLVSATYSPSSNSTNLNILRGGNYFVSHLGSGTLGSMDAFTATLTQGAGAGAITNARGFTNNFNISGTLTNLYGINTSETALSNSGTITNTYGVYVGDITSGTQINNPYSFYAVDTNAWNYFAGNTGIATTSPWGQLSVNPNALGSGVPEFVVGSSTATHFVVTGAGNVGIGTTTPATTLSVAGNGYFTGNILSGISSAPDGQHYIAIQNTDALLYAKATSGSGNNAGVQLVGGASNANWLMLTNRGDISGSGDDLVFYKNAGTTGAKLTIKDSGNVGIGTTTPWGTLSVTNTGTAPSFVVEDTTSPDTSPFLIDANGNVNIGTSTIDSTFNLKQYGNTKLQPQTSGLAYNDIFFSTSQYRHIPNGAGIFVTDPTGGLTNYPVFKTSSGRVGFGSGNLSSGLTDSKMEFRGTVLYVSALTAGAPLRVAENDAGDSNLLDIYHDSASGYNDSYYMLTGQVASSTSRPELQIGARNIKFLTSTAGNAPTGTQRAIIDSSGNFGIGTTTPTGKLSVYQSSLGSEVMRLESTASNSDPVERTFQGKVTTTDNSATTIFTVPIPTTTTVGIDFTIVARRTGGTAGTAEDGGFFKMASQYANIAGVATIIGGDTTIAGNSTTGTWLVGTVSDGAGNALIQVTGDIDTNISWSATVRTYQITN